MRAAILAGAFLLVACEPPPIPQPGSPQQTDSSLLPGRIQCRDDFTCTQRAPDSFCNQQGLCAYLGRECDLGTTPPYSEAVPPCCPGQVCNALVELCADVVVSCQSDADCHVPGQFCRPNLTSFPVSAGCTFHSCATTADCDAGQACFNSWCVSEPPCNGGCPEGDICTPVNNSCFHSDSSLGPACQQSCEPGTMLVFSDGQNTFARCDRNKLTECECLPVPTFP